MHALHRGVEIEQQQALTPAQASKALLDEFKAAGQRMPGYGHRLHTADPRTARLRELARDADVYGKFMDLADAVEEQFNAQGKPLPLNVDGAIGAVLCELDVPPLIANGFFILPRVAGLIAHYAEERSREKVMRRIDATQAVYDGPSPRELPRRS